MNRELIQQTIFTEDESARAVQLIQDQAREMNDAIKALQESLKDIVNTANKKPRVPLSVIKSSIMYLDDDIQTVASTYEAMKNLIEDND